MNLGDKVSFKKELKKVMDGSNYISKKSMEEQELEMKWLEKHKTVEHDESKEGIVVGKRRVAERTLIEMVEEQEWEGSWQGGDLAPVGIGEFAPQATDSEFINIYLVATNLRGFHRVKPEDITTIEGDSNV